MPARTSKLACAVTSLLLLGAPACKKSDRYVEVDNDPNKPSHAGKGGGGSGGDAQQAGSSAAEGGEGGGGARDMDAAVSGSGAGAGGAGGAAGDPAQDGEDAGPPPDRSCEAATEVSEYSTPVMFSDESGFGLTTGLTGFGVAFQAGRCGGVAALPVGTLGPYKSPVALFDDCSASILDVTLLHVSDGYRVVWVDNSAGSAELQSTLLADNLTLPAELARTRLTTNQVREQRPVMSNIGSAAYLAWIAADGDQREVDLQRLDQPGDAQIVLGTDSGYRPTRLALGQLGKDRGALAFVDEQGKRGIWLVPIDDAGKPASEPILLSDLVNTANTVDIATREEDGGVIVYSVDVDPTQPEVRFRRLSKLGAFLSDEIKVVGAPVKGRDASVTRLGDGYVVAYREISSSDPTRAEIRLSLITKEGTVMRDEVGRPITYHAADASSSGGRITARISIDGQLLLGFLDGDESGLKFRLIRKRLDCAL